MHTRVVKYPTGYLYVIDAGQGGVTACCLDHLNFTNVVVFDSVMHEVDCWVKSSIEGAQ